MSAAASAIPIMWERGGWRERNKFSPPLFRLFCRTPFRALLHFTPETLRLNAHQRCNPCQRMRCTFNQRVRKCKQSVLCEVFLKRHNSYCAGTVMPTRSNTLQGLQRLFFTCWAGNDTLYFTKKCILEISQIFSLSSITLNR